MTLLAAALSLAAAGCSVVPARPDGSKAPAGQWQQYQHQRPTDAQLVTWLNSGTFDGIGVVTGAVSGNLEMLELEGRAMRDLVGEQLRELAEASGLGELWQRVTTGYTEVTPSGGLHILYRVDGPVAGNTKLARRRGPDARPEVLIETRGEGGYVVVAPSNGRSHPTAKPWRLVAGGPASIATVTTEERDALHALARALDQLPTAAADSAPRPAQGQPGTVDGPGVADDYNAQTTWAELLEPRGWVRVYTAGGTTYWRRPGKAVGISATTGRNAGDNLFVFSTSTEFDAERPYSRFAAYALLEHGGDYSAAGKRLYAAGYGRRRDDIAIDLPGAGGDTSSPFQQPPAAAAEPQPPRIAGPAPRIPDEFWTARQNLAHIRAAARARGVPPDSLLGAVLARVSVLTDYRLHLPPMPRKGSLNIIVALVGTSGAGKGASMDVAVELIPAARMPCDCGDDDHAGDHTTVPAGSGEGLVRNFFDAVTVEHEGSDGKRRKETKFMIDRRHVLVSIDEGEVLSSLASRQGQTTMQILRQSWSGEELGFSYANKEKNLRIPKHHYRQSIVMGIQPTLAKGLFDDAAGGTPQRFLWFSLTDPDAPAEQPGWPGELPDVTFAGIGEQWTDTMKVDPAVAAEIRAHQRERLAGRLVVDTLDAHRMLSRVKVAALLARLELRTDVDTEDWRLAGLVLDASDAVRDWVRQAIADDAKLAGRARSIARASEAVVVDEHLTAAAIKRCAQAVMRKLGTEWMAGAALRRSLSRPSREHLEDALDLLVAAGQVETQKTGNRNGSTGVQYRRLGDHD